MRVNLRDGQWAELRERISHAQDKEIIRSRRRVRDEADAVGETETLALRIFIRDWSVRDTDGAPIALGDPDAIERMPSDLADELVGFILPILYPQATLPSQEYAKLISRLVLGQRVNEGEVDRLPDPETFRDALILATNGQWTPAALDEMDALLLSLVQKLRTSTVKKRDG